VALTPEQIAQHAHQAGFRGQALTIAVAVALAESSGNPQAHNAKPPDNSYGLWQINMLGSMGPARRHQFDIKSNDQLFQPATNAKAAFAVSSKGTNWSPWATYTNGMYKSHLDRAQRASQSVIHDKRGHKDNVPAGGKGDRRIVLDLAELAVLARKFKDFADRVEHIRRKVGDVAHSIEPARVKLADPALATLLGNVFTAMTSPTQLSRVADRLDRQGEYAAKVRALAEQADGGDNTWSRTDVRRFAGSVGKKVDPVERAVLESLLHGTIVRRTPQMDRPHSVDTSGLVNGKVPPSKLSAVGDGKKMIKPAAAHFRRMDAAARTAGLDLKVNSGYRTRGEQADLYNDYVNGRGALAARPGTSTHGLGLSADIETSNPRVLAWLRKHAEKYGFVNDVPSESWHWTYKPH
jgi:hypothetical protein